MEKECQCTYLTGMYDESYDLNTVHTLCITLYILSTDICSGVNITIHHFDGTAEIVCTVYVRVACSFVFSFLLLIPSLFPSSCRVWIWFKMDLQRWMTMDMGPVWPVRMHSHRFIL